ncbi:hypothetical protein KAI19_01670 [bacterium]|nr:hypothetical protein [bacterium]
MENKISNEYIENVINKLEKFFGVKEEISSKELFSLMKNGKVKKSMKMIAQQLDLPIDINIVNVPSDYRTQSGDNQFHSTHLARVSQHGSGSEGITAQVNIPGNLPFFGSTALNGYPINVKISKNCTEHPVVFSMVMAHELSHVLLHSLRHAEKDNEFYTDIVAMMLGFQTIFQNGRKIITTKEEHGFMSTTIRTTTTTYGYLSDEQFNFAKNKINLIFKKNRGREKFLLKEVEKFKKALSKYNITFFRFSKFIEYLSKNRSENISVDDGKKIMMFFQPGYNGDFKSSIKQNVQKINKVETFCKELFHYTDQNLNQMINYTRELETETRDLKNKLTSLRQDVRMLKKHIRFTYRIKVFSVKFGRD